MAEVVAVRTEPGWGSTSHEHITAVRLSDGTAEARSLVIHNIKYNRVQYWTRGRGITAEVVVRGCPNCAFGEFITTLPDSTTVNNLLHLPRF